MTGLTRRLRNALPKPWLFGLYGALGGLIGALVFGEALWRVLRPPPPAAVAVPPLRLAAAAALDVYQGGKNHFGVRIAREAWTGVVQLEVPRPPAGIRIEPV